MKEFLWQIAEEKNENDKSQFNGIYLVQYPKAVSYCKSICNDSESPKIEAIKFIYELNYQSQQLRKIRKAREEQALQEKLETDHAIKDKIEDSLKF